MRFNETCWCATEQGSNPGGGQRAAGNGQFRRRSSPPRLCPLSSPEPEPPLPSPAIHLDPEGERKYPKLRLSVCWEAARCIALCSAGRRECCRTRRNVKANGITQDAVRAPRSFPVLLAEHSRSKRGQGLAWTLPQQRVVVLRTTPRSLFLSGRDDMQAPSELQVHVESCPTALDDTCTG